MHNLGVTFIDSGLYNGASMKTIIGHTKALKFQLLLLLAAAIWGLGTVLIKSTIDAVPAFWLAGIRFFSAGVIMCIAFAPQLVKLASKGELLRHMKVGLIIGIPMIIGYMTNTWGLTDTTAAKSSFLSGLYCVMVPFLAWFMMRKRPTAFNISAAVLCLVGVGLVSLYGKSDLVMSWGDGITLFSAVMFGVQVVLTAKFAPGMNMMAITALEFIFGGALAIGFAAFTQAPPSLALLTQPDVLGSLAYIVLFATCAALLLQNVGLAKVQPSSGALLLSFESVFGVIFSIAFLGEALTIPMACGFVLIFAAVLVSEWLPNAKIANDMADMGKTLRKLARMRLAQRNASRANIPSFAKSRIAELDRGVMRSQESRASYQPHVQGSPARGAGQFNLRS